MFVIFALALKAVKCLFVIFALSHLAEVDGGIAPAAFALLVKLKGPCIEGRYFDIRILHHLKVLTVHFLLNLLLVTKLLCYDYWLVFLV